MMKSGWICLLLSLAMPFPADARTWTNAQGHALEADYVSADGAKVKLKLKDGRVVDYPLTQLSQADRDFIATQAEQPGVVGKPVAEEGGNSFNKPWPERVELKDDPEVNIVKEDEEKKEYVYESGNFRFRSNVRFSKTVVRGFAKMFEATLLYVQALPLGFTEGERTDGKYQILIFEKEEDYTKAGGHEGMAGVFSSSQKAVLTPIESLGVRTLGSGYTLDRDKSNVVLIHELTHQLTPPAYFGEDDNGWFFEGVAEYVANTPYRNGTFQVKASPGAQISRVVAYGKDDMEGRALGESFTAPHLEKFMSMDYKSFTGENGNFNYGFGLLLTTYFFHLDGDGDAKRMKAYLQGLATGKQGKASLEPLLDGRSWEKLEKDVAAALKRKRVEVEFGG